MSACTETPIKHESQAPSPVPHSDGATTEQVAERQQQLFEQYYVEDDDPNGPPASPPPPPVTNKPKKSKRGSAMAGLDTTEVAAKKQKSLKAAAATDSDDAELPTKKTKTPKSAATSNPAPPRRHSGREIKRVMPFEYKQVSPLTAKKSKSVASVNETADVKQVVPAPKPYPTVNTASTEVDDAAAPTAPSNKRVDSATKSPPKKSSKSKAPAKMSKKEGKKPQQASPDASSDSDAEHQPKPKAKGKGKAKEVAPTTSNNDAVTDVDDQPAERQPKTKAKAQASSSGKQMNLAGCERHPTGMGTTAIRPENADLDEPWCCANRHCSTGMTYYYRDPHGNSSGIGRKTISDYLGRNKKETKTIDNNVWHLYCRKCYQRLHYAAQNGAAEGLFNWHISNLRVQFLRLKLWRPDARFKSQLVKSMLARSNEYQTILRRNHDDKDAAMQEYTSPGHKGADTRTANKNGDLRTFKDEEVFPVDQVDDFQADCCGTDFDYDDIEQALQHIETMFGNGQLQQMPPIEFLIKPQRDDEQVNDPDDNYLSWIAHSDHHEHANEVGSTNLLNAVVSDTDSHAGTDAEPIDPSKPSLKCKRSRYTESEPADQLDPADAAERPIKRRRERDTAVASAPDSGSDVNADKPFSRFRAHGKKKHLKRRSEIKKPKFNLRILDPETFVRKSSNYGCMPGDGRGGVPPTQEVLDYEAAVEEADDEFDTDDEDDDDDSDDEAGPDDEAGHGLEATNEAGENVDDEAGENVDDEAGDDYDDEAVDSYDKNGGYLYSDDDEAADFKPIVRKKPII